MGRFNYCGIGSHRAAANPHREGARRGELHFKGPSTYYRYGNELERDLCADEPL